MSGLVATGGTAPRRLIVWPAALGAGRLRTPPWLLHLAVLGAFVGVAYYPSLGVPFVFDDVTNIVVNPAVHPASAGDLTRVLQSAYSPDRPLALLSFALNFLWGGLDVTGYHIVNVALHLANAWLVYALLTNLLPLSGMSAHRAPGSFAQIAFWGAALWALHPVHTQAVTYIVQRMTSLVTLFYLVGVALFILYRRRRLSAFSSACGIGVAFVLGMASKPIVVTLPLALVMLDYLCTQRAWAPRRWVVLGIVAGGLAIGLWYSNGKIPDWNQTYTGRSFFPLERLMTESRVLWHYLSLWLWPVPQRLHLDYDVMVSRSLWQPVTTLPAILGVGGLLALAWCIRRRAPLATIAIGWFFLASSVEASFLDLEIAFIHRIYLPSVFLFAGALALVPATTLARGGPILLLVLAALAGATIVRNAEWSSAPELWRTDLERGASSRRALLSRAVELAALGQREAAIETLVQRLNPDEVRARVLPSYELGVALYLDGQHLRAARILDEHIEQFGASPAAVLYRALIHLQTGQPEAAAGLMHRLDDAHPGHPYGRIIEARIAELDGDLPRAERILTEVLRLSDGGDVGVRNLLRMHLSNVYLRLEAFDRAYRLYLDAIGEDPANYAAWTQIYRMQVAAGDIERAATIRRFLESKGVDLTT